MINFNELEELSNSIDGIIKYHQKNNSKIKEGLRRLKKNFGSIGYRTLRANGRMELCHELPYATKFIIYTHNEKEVYSGPISNRCTDLFDREENVRPPAYKLKEDYLSSIGLERRNGVQFDDFD